jgi:hypothetical protein
VSGYKRLTALLVGIPLGIVAVAWVLLFGVMHVESSDTTLVAAALGFTGVVVTACVSAIGVTVNRQAERRLEQQRIDERNRLRSTPRCARANCCPAPAVNPRHPRRSPRGCSR